MSKNFENKTYLNISFQVEYFLKFLIFNRLYKTFNLIEGFNYYFNLKQVITLERITNCKQKACPNILEKGCFRIILHEF